MGMISKHRILVVDDEQAVRDLCREFLELQNYSVDEARNGHEALEQMNKTSYSLILSDVMMPDINGLELASTVRKRYPDTLVILITGHATIDLAKDAIQRGAFDFVTKPFKISELKSMVERALKIRSKQLSVLPSPELKDLYELTVNLNISAQSLKTYLESLAASLMKTFRGDASRVYLTNEPGGFLFTKAASAGDEGILPDKDWDGEVLAGLGVEGGVLDGSEDNGSSRDSSVSSLMAVPIPSQEGNLGCCVVVRAFTPVEFTSRDLKLLGLFAAQAGNQLINYRMTSDLKQQADNLKQVNILAGEFSSSLDTKSVLESISRGLRSMVSFDLFGVYLRGKDMTPLSYMLVRSDLPDGVLQGEFRDILEEKLNSYDVNQFLESNIRDSFASLAEAHWKARPQVDLLDLGALGSLQGMVVLGGWCGNMSHIGKSSHIPILLRHAAAALSNAYLFETNERNYIQTISALAGAVDAKDPYTHNHSRNVAAYATSIAASMRLPSRDIALLNNAALLHDIGKIGIPESILNKAGPLTEDEYYVINKHPQLGYNILRPVTAFSSFIDAVRYHHERYDGTGYPSGLSGLQIPLYARIMAVADGFDAMTSDRIYRKALGLDYARRELSDNLGSQFDPVIGRTFLGVLDRKNPKEMIGEYLAKISNQLTFKNV
jgi:putative nucleotidyltransferase with HDIG domain